MRRAVYHRCPRCHSGYNAVIATVTTSRAAEIVGIGYEGLRSHLKRGLLGPSERTWKRFTFSDLCVARLAKLMLDIGLSFEMVKEIAAFPDLRLFLEPNNAAGLLLVWVPGMGCAVVSDQSHELFHRHLDGTASAVVVRLFFVSAHVLERFP